MYASALPVALCGRDTKVRFSRSLNGLSLLVAFSVVRESLTAC